MVLNSTTSLAVRLRSVSCLPVERDVLIVLGARQEGAGVGSGKGTRPALSHGARAV